MNTPKNRKKSAPELTQSADKPARTDTAGTRSLLSEIEMKRLVQELEVHQVELEMQNEELRQAQEALEASRNAYA